MLCVIPPGDCAKRWRARGRTPGEGSSRQESVAENQQKHHQYRWTETTQLTLQGDAKPPKTEMCQYGPDGKVQKIPEGAPPPPPSGGRDGGAGRNRTDV